MLSFNFAIAQNTVSGTVKDSTNEPLPGANIIEKGTNNGTTTDFDGNYTLKVGANATLVFSYSGFETKEVAVNGQNTLNVVLAEGVALDEIVITGSRTPARSNTKSPLPVDIVSAKDLVSTGQAILTKLYSTKYLLLIRYKRL